MFHVIRQKDLQPSPNRTVEFQGEEYGAGISFLLVDNEPGQGPRLHLHPYPETWVVRTGRAQIRAGEDEIEAGPGDVVVVEANTPHAFSNLGPGASRSSASTPRDAWSPIGWMTRRPRELPKGEQKPRLRAGLSLTGPERLELSTPGFGGLLRRRQTGHARACSGGFRSLRCAEVRSGEYQFGYQVEPVHLATVDQREDTFRELGGSRRVGQCR